MKKNLFYLFALICSMSLFTACSDDDDVVNEELNTTFTSTDASNQLLLTYSDQPMLGKSVTFNSTDGKTATIILSGAPLSLTRNAIQSALTNPGVIPGEATTTLNVALVSVGEGYTFAGKDESNNRVIEYKGAIEKGKLSLALNVKITNNLLGTWNLYPYDEEDFFATTFPLRLVWETSKTFPLDIFGMGFISDLTLGQFLTLMSAPKLINNETMNLHGAISALLKDVTFKADGNIVATYSTIGNLVNPAWTQSPLNIAQYNVRDGKIYLYLDLQTILAGIMGGNPSTRIDLSDFLPSLMQLLPLVSNGIPLGYSVDANGVLGVYIEKELGMQIVRLITPILQDEEVMASIMESMMADPVFSAYIGVMQVVFTQFEEVTLTTTKVELGLNFSKP